MPGTVGILYGPVSAPSTAIYPSATIAAWDKFIVTAAPGATQSAGNGGTGSGVQGTFGLALLVLGVGLTISAEMIL